MKKIVKLFLISLLILTFTGCDADDGKTITYINPDTDTLVNENSDGVEANISVNDGNTLKFSTSDIDGNPVTDEIIKDAKVVMINFFEPWCGPCVGEMPSIEKLYEEYKDQGLLVLGVFSTPGMDDDVKQIINDCGTSYPVIRSDSNLEKYMTEYVPTTVFADSEGNIISPEPVVGANSYSDWEEMIIEYLK